MTCNSCKTEGHSRLRFIGSGLFVCAFCVPSNPIQADSSGIHIQNKVFINGYGNVSEKRLKEMDRRTILPTKRNDGGYYLGRRGENGKIQERHPTY